MARAKTRTQPCDRSGALTRLAQAESFLEAVELLAAVQPNGPAMAKDLQRLLNRKDNSQYGLAFVSAGEAGRMVGWAKRLLRHARRTVEA